MNQLLENYLTLENLSKVLGLNLDNKDSDKDLWRLKGTPLSDMMFLYHLVSLLPNSGSILEVGTFRGRTTILMGLGTYGKNINIYTIDNFKVAKEIEEISEIEAIERVNKNIEDFGLSKKIHLIVGASNNVAKTWSTPLDMFFVDGDHTYEGVRDDIINFVPFLKPGGFLIFHDYTSPFGKVKEAINSFLKKDDFICYDQHYAMLSEYQSMEGLLGLWSALFIKKGNPEIEEKVNKLFTFIRKPFGKGCNNCVLIDFLKIEGLKL